MAQSLKGAALLVILTSVLSIPALPSITEPSYPSLGDWTIMTIDEGNQTPSRYVSLALDSYDSPRLSFWDGHNSDVVYASWNGSGWESEIVDPLASGIAWTSLGLDSTDTPHICYHRKGFLHYAVWNGSTWNIELADTTGGGGFYCSISVDSQNNPHISYYSGAWSNLKYATKNESGWRNETVDSSGSVGAHTSIDVDSQDRPHISYHAHTNNDLKYAVWNGSAWAVETVSHLGMVGFWSSLTLDSGDNPHISFYDASNGDLRYAWWNGTDWFLETVDAQGDVGYSTSIALDSQEFPHISYEDYGNENLQYARWNGTEWLIETVDYSMNTSLSSIALDSDDKPHIGYNSISRDVMYATKAELPGPPEPEERTTTLNIDPDTLNLRSKGRWMTAYLSAENASVHDMDVSTILLQDALAPERWDYQDDVLMLKFNRQDFKDTVQVGESVQVKITGKWEDGTAFEAYDSIRVIEPGK